MRDDIKEVVEYIFKHSKRLEVDIANADKKHEDDRVEYYKGAKDTCVMFLRLIDDVLEKNKEC
jgi:hypothetical protein